MKQHKGIKSKQRLEKQQKIKIRKIKQTLEAAQKKTGTAKYTVRHE